MDVAGKMHSLYETLLLYPPEGYEIVTRGTQWDKIINKTTQINLLYSIQESVIQKIVPINLFKAYAEKFKKPPFGTALTYSTGHLVFRNEPWLVDLEFVTQLAGYNLGHFRKFQKLIERTLASKYCKNIICWTEAGKRTVLDNMNCDGFENKVEVVNLAVSKKKFIKDHDVNKEHIKLLFVGSSNIPGEFEYKGGIEVLEAFMILRQKYSNLELVIRSDTPKIIKDKYKNVDGLTIIDDTIPWEQIEQEFKSADIFLCPHHSTPGLVILDAMSYELPVITTDVWANPEMVIDDVTGLVIKKSEKVQYYADNFIPIWSYKAGSTFMKSIQNIDLKVVNELIEKTIILIENPEIRRKMGKAGRQETETGKYSIENRNKKLKKIFDEAISI